MIGHKFTKDLIFSNIPFTILSYPAGIYLPKVNSGNTNTIYLPQYYETNLPAFTCSKSTVETSEQYSYDGIKKRLSRHLLAQSQSWKHQNNVWNRFKVNNNDSKKTPLMSF